MNAPGLTAQKGSKFAQPGAVQTDIEIDTLIHEDGPARETLLEPRTAELRSFLNAVLH